MNCIPSNVNINNYIYLQIKLFPYILRNMLYKIKIMETITEYYNADSKEEAEKMAMSDSTDYDFEYAELDNRMLIRVEKDVREA